MSAELFAQVLKRGGHGLLEGGVRAHRAAELLGGQAVGERLRRAADHVARMLAHELRADKLVRFGVGDKLHEAAARVGDDRLGVAEHDVLADLDGDPHLFGFRLREADDRDLGTTVDAARHDREIGVILHAAQALDTGNALRGGDVGELDF